MLLYTTSSRGYRFSILPEREREEDRMNTLFSHVIFETSLLHITRMLSKHFFNQLRAVQIDTMTSASFSSNSRIKQQYLLSVCMCVLICAFIVWNYLEMSFHQQMEKKTKRIYIYTCIYIWNNAEAQFKRYCQEIIPTTYTHVARHNIFVTYYYFFIVVVP